MSTRTLKASSLIMPLLLSVLFGALWIVLPALCYDWLNLEVSLKSVHEIGRGPLETLTESERAHREAAMEAAGESATVLIENRPSLLTDHWKVVLQYHQEELVFWGYRIIATLACLSLVWFIGRLFRLLVWQKWMIRRTGQAAPKLLGDVTMGVLFAVASLFIISEIYMKSVTTMLAASGVLGIVLGFALRSMIADFFSGVALNVERPYGIGDWIAFDGHVGRVAEINWRATRLVTKDSQSIVVPNGRIAEGTLKNYSKPESYYRTSVEVILEYEVPVEKAKRVLHAAVKCVDMICDDPEPDVHCEFFGDDGVHYEVRFFVPSYAKQEDCKDAVCTALFDHLFRAGMQIPYPKRDTYITRMPDRYVDPHKDPITILSRVDFFESLDRETLGYIAEAMTERLYEAGDTVVKQGDTTSSLFVIVEGMLHVYIDVEESMKQVAILEPGKFFGEMSLLTGRPRTASVIAGTDVVAYEITDEKFAPVLEKKPFLMEEFSKVIVEREARTRRAHELFNETTKAREAASLVQKMKGFFKKRR